MASYTELTLGGANLLLEPFGVTPIRLRPLSNGAANSSFVVGSADRDYVLTILDNHDKASATTLVSTIDYLARSGILVDTLVRARDGSAIRPDARGVPYVVKHFISGSDLLHPSDQQLGSIGARLADVHRLPPPDFVPTGRRLLPEDTWELIELGPPAEALRVLLGRGESISDSARWKALPIGLCHGDLFGDNMIARSDTGDIAILDWETASVDPLLLDLAITCAAFMADSGQSMIDRVDLIVAGYQTVRPLEQTEHDALSDAIVYSLAMLAFHRFVRQNVRFPDPAKSDNYRELVDRADRWISTMQG